MKTANTYLDEANAVVERITPEDAVNRHSDADNIFIDVRDSADIAETGTIKGALRIPRGFIEFAADDTMPFHNKALTRDANLYLVCGLGGQAALAGKTLKDMGYKSVTNVGGIGEWKDAGGPVEKD